MKLKDLFKKKEVTTVYEKIVKTTLEVEDAEKEEKKEKDALGKVAPKAIGVLDMVIAFDTTGSMAAYIDAVRREVSELIPRLFKDNDNLRLGIVAFGDYCDMNSATDFGDAYQCLMPTDNENDIIKFIRESRDTSGGDGDEFYELVIKKIVEETPWRKDATKAILLISDANPHPLGYTYKDHVVGNQIDWRKEAEKAAFMNIKIDTVTITDEPWYKELSKMTNGISVPFESGYKTARLVEAATMSRGSMASRMKFDKMARSCADEEMSAVFNSYRKERDDV
ncbi:MAG: VWA domain-containing protein [Bacteroidaceae bacterium]|nr:VWA domain-containing protein [Bacteroidaceae bacterium]